MRHGPWVVRLVGRAEQSAAFYEETLEQEVTLQKERNRVFCPGQVPSRGQARRWAPGVKGRIYSDTQREYVCVCVCV